MELRMLGYLIDKLIDGNANFSKDNRAKMLLVPEMGFY